MPVDESAPLREDRHPYRGERADLIDYSKLEVEEEYARRGAVVLRLPAVYGERDRQRREDFVLRRVRAGRDRIPIGPGGLLLSRAYVRDIARGVCQAALDPARAGETFNLAEERTWTLRQWAGRILAAAGSTAELVTVPDAVLPADMHLTAGGATQHVLISSARARARLGYEDSDPAAAIAASVAWHLANPPEDGALDVAADDRALAAAL